MLQWMICRSTIFQGKHGKAGCGRLSEESSIKLAVTALPLGRLPLILTELNRDYHRWYNNPYSGLLV